MRSAIRRLRGIQTHYPLTRGNGRVFANGVVYLYYEA
jgi:hypothetical protein